MMKNLLMIFTFLLSVVLTGCGSNSKPDGGENTALSNVLELQGQEIIQAPNGIDFSLTMPFEKKIAEAYLVKLSGFSLEVAGGCTINSIGYTPATTLEFDGGEGSEETLYVSGAFDANCTPTGYTFTATQTITQGSQSDTRQVSFTYDYNNPDGVSSVTPPSEDGYSFYNATTPLEITQANTTYLIKVQLLKDGYVAEGETVVLQPFANTYGDVADYDVTTGTDGYAKFVYTSPEVLPASGSSVTLTADYFLEDNSTIAPKGIVLNFTSTAGGGSAYSLVNTTTPVEITYANEVEIISTYVVDSMNVGVSGKTVKISTPSFGDMTSSTAVTDDAGKAEFTYKAPANLTGLSNTMVTMYLEEDGTTYSADVNITVTPAVVGTSEYNLTNASTPVNVHYAKEIKEISVQLIKNDGTPQVGKTVVAKSIPSAFGSISNVNVTTGSDGYARFTYVAADPLTDGIQPLELYYDDMESGERVTSIVEINVTEETLPLPYVVVPDAVKENNLTVNNELVELPIRVFMGGTNTPYSEGKVKVQLPDEVTEGVDVGSFEAYEVDIVNGIATFNYTGPNDLESLIADGNLSSTFLFYHEDNADDSVKQPVVMIYDPDPAQGYIPVNYELVINAQTGNMTMGLQEEKSFSAILKDDLGDLVPDSNITSFTITSKNTLVGKLLNDGNETETLTILGKNPVNFNVRTYTKSGLLPIDITVDFVDPNGISKEMNQTINIVVYSGPATAMSISYVGVEHDEVQAKYIEKFAVTVVDAYNNRVNTQPNIAVGGMVEYAVDGSSPDGERTETSPRLWYGKFDTPHGSVVPAGDGTATFVTPSGSNIFRYVDFYNDKLVVFGEGYVYEALGKWDIAQASVDSNLTLLDEYNGAQRDDLLYAVGHNYRSDLCADDDREYVGYAKSDTYQVNSEGTALVEFVYDYHLTGKDIMLWVNLSGYQADTDTTTRIGEARKHTLRGNGLVPLPSEGYTFRGFAGDDMNVTFEIEHENAPEMYQNAHFAHFIRSGSTCYSQLIDTSNNYDARSCINGGKAYVTYTITIPNGEESCTFAIDDVMVSPEF